MIRFLLLSTIFCFATSALAAPTDSLTARRTAARFLASQDGARLTTKSINTTASKLELRATSSASYLFADHRGRFVLASADDKLPAILGYGTASPQDKEMPAALRDLITSYDRLLRRGNVRLLGSDGGAAVSPLLTAVRHQKSPYNAYCPHYTVDGVESEARCVVGCVATALEEVISYYKRQVTLVDTLHGWATDHYVIDDILPGATVDCSLIRENYDSLGTYTDAEADAVARLSYYLGVAVHMNYGLSESGASVSRVEEPLRRAFGFGYVHYADSYKYTPEDWLAMLRREIRAARPVFYAGFAVRMNGHAVVLDGLDDDGLFHVNWGVDGDYDGYFHLDLLNAAEPAWDITETGRSLGFAYNQEAVLIHPDALDVTLPDTLSRTGTEIFIDSVSFPLQPEASKISPIRFHLRNTASTSLTTPLEFFLNTPADTALFEQGYYLAISGVTLAAQDTCTLTVMAQFSASGDYTLHASADDENLLCAVPVTVNAYAAPALTFPEPTADFPEATEISSETTASSETEGSSETEATSETCTLRIMQPIDNTSGEGRAGVKVTYELFEGEPLEDHNGTAHALYCFLPAGEVRTDTVLFRGLTPGQSYTLYVRCPWTIRHTVRVTCPVPTSITSPTLSPGASSSSSSSPLYDLTGRRITQPARGQIYIKSGQKSYAQ